MTMMMTIITFIMFMKKLSFYNTHWHPQTIYSLV